MKLTLDTESRKLTVEDNGASRDLPLYSRNAFDLLSREWIRVGWAEDIYYTYRWFGRQILQLPEDLVRLQEAIYEIQPDFIVETGIHNGGSVLFHASLCEAMNHGQVVGIDIRIGGETRGALSQHALAHRIHLIEADSESPETAEAVRRLTAGRSVMVILDSDHSKGHVWKELENYAPLVTPGSCLVVADGVMHDLADVPGGDPSWIQDNPGAASLEFAAAHPEFELRERPWPNVTYFPHGWLWRKA